MNDTITHIARVCHEVNRAVCIAHGDHSQVAWEDAPEWQKQSAIKGVAFRFDNPTAEPAAQHVAWCDDKYADGWKYGPIKDAVAKTHPCLVSYWLLPPEQRLKDKLFQAVVDTLR